MTPSPSLYLSDGFEIIGVANQNGQVLETFTRGVGLGGDIGTLVAVTHHAGSSTNGTFYVHNNNRGDIVQTRSGTATTGTYDYSVFGTLKSQTGTDVCRFKFSSKEREASTSFSYYGFRFYAPQWQRWPNRDPINEGGGINLYAYVGNDPVNYVDKYGLDLGGDLQHWEFALKSIQDAMRQTARIIDSSLSDQSSKLLGKRMQDLIRQERSEGVSPE